ncbi:hypothetical protein PFLA_b0620 [Pseudoalteromonas flavipulchra NCIMB 2033 = ATCC BAA-314]|nr:hypothetical protein [Pseudoalteromonas flavipulchra NCIMB 2033 = ATCC BAA-314]
MLLTNKNLILLCYFLTLQTKKQTLFCEKFGSVDYSFEI